LTPEYARGSGRAVRRFLLVACSLARPCFVAVCASLFMPSGASAQTDASGAEPAASAAPELPAQPVAAEGETIRRELARMRAEITTLNKSLTSWLEEERQRRRREGWFEAQRAEQKRLRVGPAAGFLVGGGLLAITGTSLLAIDSDDFMPLGTPMIVAGGLLVITGVAVLTRLLRKRRAIEREIEAELLRPLPAR
jgi:hypothetical protein